MAYNSLEGHDFKIKDDSFNKDSTFSIITRSITLIYQKPPRKQKMPEQSKENCSKKPGSKKGLNFTVGINITLPN